MLATPQTLMQLFRICALQLIIFHHSLELMSTFQTIQKGESMLELHDATVRLHTYTGEPIRVHGSTMVRVEHNGQSKHLPLLITGGDGLTLPGRNWLEALYLDWRTIFRAGGTLTLQKVLEQHPDVFKEELGELQRASAKIHVEEDAQPRLEKPRQVHSPSVTKSRKS